MYIYIYIYIYIYLYIYIYVFICLYICLCKIYSIDSLLYSVGLFDVVILTIPL